MQWPVVTRLKYARSAGKRQGIWLFRPMTPFRATAAMAEMSISGGAAVRVQKNAAFLTRAEKSGEYECAEVEPSVLLAHDDFARYCLVVHLQQQGVQAIGQVGKVHRKAVRRLYALPEHQTTG